jgi:hypothetical protein
MNNNCAYHPDRKAITICYRCRRPICFEDRRISQNTGQKEYCIPCKANQVKSNFNFTPLFLYLYLFL